ncbi:MAG TPA: OB-fold domain-containing protein [Ilumatobacteraceae bacterium]|nr:OB-fold domain-containing protein [Ilumatobacteraceae bacterium]
MTGWFTERSATGTNRPALTGQRCGTCGTYVFPPRSGGCPSPHCTADELESVELSSAGRVWSYTENRYAPPPPYVAPDPFVPYALAAVELEREGIVVLGKVGDGLLAADLRVGMPMRLGLEVSHRDGDHDVIVYTWVPDTGINADAGTNADDGSQP